ncbi:MAG: cardiolipin synthase [Paracoccaceae bacterium]|jgi:cardiolipin synthase
MSDTANAKELCWTEELARDGSAVLTKGNKVDLYFEGKEAFAAMRSEIAGAERFVNLEMYMFLSDRVGRAIAEELGRKARSGVPVRVVYDAIGSAEAEDEMFEEMRAAGVRVEIFRPVAPWRKRSGILGRNHRKNLIIDGRVAFTGGMNLGEVWSGEFSGNAWRDTHMKMEGPAAAACQHFFEEAWVKVGGKKLEEDCFFRSGQVGEGKSDCVIVGGSGFGTRRAIRRLYSRAFALAKSEVVMTVPYFVPPKRVLDVMRRRSLEGVKVRVLVPKNSDVAVADWLREGLYPSLMDDGIKFHEYRGRVLHAKSMVFDDQLAVVGSANFDYLSISLNWELAVVVDDPVIVGQLVAQYHLDLEVSEAVEWDWAESRPWWRRAFAWIGAAILRRL